MRLRRRRKELLVKQLHPTVERGSKGGNLYGGGIEGEVRALCLRWVAIYNSEIKERDKGHFVWCRFALPMFPQFVSSFGSPNRAVHE